MSYNKQDPQVAVVATPVENSAVVVNATVVSVIPSGTRSCRDCGGPYVPRRGVSTREEMRCDECNRAYDAGDVCDLFPICTVM
jgi:hypothetical protein